jgi:hypothetical protein
VLQSVQVRIDCAAFRSSGEYFSKEDLGRPIVVVLDVVHHFCARGVLEGCLECLRGRKVRTENDLIRRYRAISSGGYLPDLCPLKSLGTPDAIDEWDMCVQVSRA